MQDQIRQGDILLEETNKKVPKGVAAKTEVVLAEGEMTGHAHRLKAAEIFEWSENGQRYVHVAGHEPGTLSHEEHDPMPDKVVEPGITYKVIPQNEWDLSGQWRKVVD